MKEIRATFRLIVFFVMTLGIYAIWRVGSMIVRNKPYWRQSIFRTWARGFQAVSGMKIELTGKPPQTPFLLVANHLSYIDIAAFGAAIDTVFVAKKEIRHWYVAGKIINDMGTIFIDRNNRRDIPRAGREIMQKLDEGECVVLFPEGTSTKGEKVLPFNSSVLDFASKGEIPVCYASLTYSTASGDPPPSVSICWWDDTVFIVHLWRLFALKGFTAIINFGENAIINSDRKNLAKELHRQVSEKFIPNV